MKYSDRVVFDTLLLQWHSDHHRDLCRDCEGTGNEGAQCWIPCDSCLGTGLFGPIASDIPKPVRPDPIAYPPDVMSVCSQTVQHSYMEVSVETFFLIVIGTAIVLLSLLISGVCVGMLSRGG